MNSTGPALAPALSSRANSIPAEGSVAKLADLQKTPAGRKLKQAAGEFEAMLLSDLWKSMKSTFAAEEEDSADPAHDSLEDLTIQTMSRAVGQGGGLGLGNLILKHLTPRLENSHAGDAPLPPKLPSPVADRYP